MNSYRCAGKFIGLAIAAILGAATAALTQAADDKSSTAQQPSPEMQSLMRVIAGRWSTQISYANEANSPDTVRHGEQVWRSGPGGFTLLEEERIETVSGEQYLLAVHWWDRDAKQFKGLLCNNSGTGACNIDTYFNSSVAWDGKTLKIDLSFPQGDKKMHWHEVFSDFAPNSFTQTGEMGEEGGVLKRVLIIHATRMASAISDN